MKLAQTIIALAFAAVSAGAAAQEVTLKAHTFLGGASPTVTRLLEPWAERIAAQSDGRIKIDLYPSMALGGRAQDLYRQARDGEADIVWTLTGYTPGVFPHVEVFELPTVHQGSAYATTMAIQDRFDLVAEDFSEIQPLLVHAHAGNALHVVDRAIATPDDVSGLTIRTPSRTGAWMIAEWGARPVGMPATALPQAISKGQVNAALTPFEVAPALSVPALTRYSVEGAGGRRFGTVVFLLAMNKERYEALPEDLRAVIDANSGAALAEEAGRIWDEIEAPGREAQIASGGEIIQLGAAATADFDALGEKVVERWIAEADGLGLDGAALVAAAREAIAARR